ncbi:MAG: NADH-quinone oxidoreductase subunit C [Clostridia bacterium]|nr:NADH-quinone oxidoreductase subunit C [Clostridia bacterium]
MKNEKNYPELLTGRFGDKTVFNPEKPNEVYTDGDNLISVLEFLKNEGLNFLADISSVDYKEYFEVVYQLFSFDNSDHLTIKVKLDHNNPQVPSATALWETANWLEREVYDLMGITFINHPNLERILTWEGFEGHPLRKDFVSKKQSSRK